MIAFPVQYRNCGFCFSVKRFKHAKNVSPTYVLEILCATCIYERTFFAEATMSLTTLRNGVLHFSGAYSKLYEVSGDSDDLKASKTNTNGNG